MSAVPRTSPAPTGRPSRTGAAGAVLHATRAELSKILTLPGVWIVTGIILALDVLVMSASAGLYAEAVANITPDGIIEIFIGEPQPATGAVLDMLVAASLQIGVFLPIPAAVIAGQEFRSHQLGLTVLAVPRRGRLLAAKVLATTAYLLAVAVLIAGISTAFTYAAVKDWNPGLLLTGDAFLGQGRFVVFAVLFSLTGFAVTVIARSTLIGIVVTVVLLALTMMRSPDRTGPGLDAFLPAGAGRNLLLDAGANHLSAGPVHGLLVLVGWALVTTLIAGITLGRRDAR
ncbi:ABC transporter permease [Streptosporangium sp. NPDC050855]|uniref:ABC transporter permease n=1 Tax=Streptosporangium sp. NPDC050855 TaxID=3366194 RepID=UPI0037B22406